MEAKTLLQIINEALNTNFESVELLKDYVKDYIFNADNDDRVIDLKSNDIVYLFTDFNSTKLANLCGLPQSSLSDKILKGLNGVIYNDKDINVYELSRYLRDKKIDTIAFKDFRECIQETIFTIEISLHKNNEIEVIENDIPVKHKIVNIAKVKTTKIDKIENYSFILDNFTMVSGETAKLYYSKAVEIPAGKKFEFKVVASQK